MRLEGDGILGCVFPWWFIPLPCCRAWPIPLPLQCYRRLCLAHGGYGRSGGEEASPHTPVALCYNTHYNTCSQQPLPLLKRRMTAVRRREAAAVVEPYTIHCMGHCMPTTTLPHTQKEAFPCYPTHPQDACLLPPPWVGGYPTTHHKQNPPPPPDRQADMAHDRHGSSSSSSWPHAKLPLLLSPTSLGGRPFRLNSPLGRNREPQHGGRTFSFGLHTPLLLLSLSLCSVGGGGGKKEDQAWHALRGTHFLAWEEGGSTA